MKRPGRNHNLFPLLLGLVVLALSATPARTASEPPLDLGESRLEAPSGQALAAVLELDDVRVSSRRLASGSIRSELRSNEGRLLARSTWRPDGRLRMKVAATPGGPRGRSTRAALSREDAQRPPLTWSNLQLMSWWLDYSALARESTGRRLAGELRHTERDGGLLRPESLIDPNGAPRAELLAARAERAQHYFVDTTAISERSGDGFATRLTLADDGELAGWLSWNTARESLSWSVGWEMAEQMSEITPDLLPDGAWPFRPSLAWANQFLFDRRQQATLPLKDTPGCTGLHFLDGTQLRACCDDHDLCYKAHKRWTGAACSALSWFWPLVQNPQSTWRCQQCNIQAVTCFALRIIRFQQVSWSPQPYCYLTIPGLCPVECSGCETCDSPWHCPP